MLPFLGIKTIKTKVSCVVALGIVFVSFLGCSKSDTASESHSAAVCAAPRPAAEVTALDRYVSALDTNYSFHLSDLELAVEGRVIYGAIFFVAATVMLLLSWRRHPAPSAVRFH